MGKVPWGLEARVLVLYTSTLLLAAGWGVKRPRASKDVEGFAEGGCPLIGKW